MTHKVRSIFIPVAIALGSFVGSTVALAGPLAPVVIQQSAGGFEGGANADPPELCPTYYTQSAGQNSVTCGFRGSAGTLSSDVTLGVGPSISAFASNTPGPGGNLGGNGVAAVLLAYQVEIVGPGGEVPINVQGSGAVGGVDFNPIKAFAFLSVGSTDAAGTSFQGCAGDDGPCNNMAYPNSFSLNQTFDVQANTPINVFMSVEALIGGDFTSDSTFAYVDPIFTIGPGYSDYSLIYSPGLLPSSVPEPATWALLLAAIFGAGAIARIARRSADKTLLSKP